MVGIGGLVAEPPRYRVELLSCAVFQETVRTTIRGTSGSATVVDQAGRDGMLAIRLRGAEGSTLELEGWYDSLAVWRRTEAGPETADADGFLGGRYRGTLTADGRYLSRTGPFVPDDLAQIADLGTVLDDFLPRLPVQALAPGRDWNDGAGLVIQRLDDRRESVGILERYRWTFAGRRGERIDAGDSAAVTLDQTVRDEGELRWSGELGPVGWTRRIVVNARVPATGRVRRPMHSTVEQQITVVRRLETDLVGRVCAVR